MEAVLATLTSTRLYDLLERLFHHRRGGRGAFLQEAKGGEFSVVRRLAHDELTSLMDADDVWLKRVELRGSRAVTELLESIGFRKQRSEVHALFVDGRCGLIRTCDIGNLDQLDCTRAVAEVLAKASNCHADGMILATNDLDERADRTLQWHRLTFDLHRKGEATEIFLLDHFVLKRGGWTRMLAGPDRSH